MYIETVKKYRIGDEVVKYTRFEEEGEWCRRVIKVPAIIAKTENEAFEFATDLIKEKLYTFSGGPGRWFQDVDITKRRNMWIIDTSTAIDC